MRPKILFLVAGEAQLDAISYAREMGYYIITCDNTRQNPGHKLANESLFISTYDKEQIFEAVKNKKLSAVVNFVSEHGVETAAFLIEKLRLKGVSLSTLYRLSNKSEFRKFLKGAGLSVPSFVVAGSFDASLLESLDLPVIIKPVDSGGNKGISKIQTAREAEEAFNFGLKYSASGKVIIEEYLKGEKHINGDFLVIDNKIVYSLIGDYHYNPMVNPILPYATTFPSETETSKINKELEKVLRKLEFGSGVLNLEAIIVGSKIYFIEINPRHSGNLIYKLMTEDTGIDFAQIAVELALGRKAGLESIKSKNKYLAYCLLYSSHSGIIKNIELSPGIRVKVINKVIFKKTGDFIQGFENLKDRIGVLLMKFTNRSEMDDIISNSTQHYKIHFLK